MKDIVAKYNIDDTLEFERYIREKGFLYKDTVFGTTIPDEYVEVYVRKYEGREAEDAEKKRIEDEKAAEEARKVAEEEAQRIKLQAEYRNKIYSCKKTTGYTFDGYKITQYLDIVNGEIVLGTGFLSEFSAGMNDLFGTSSGMFSSKLQQAREHAQAEMIVKAVSMGANAIIGIDFDYITFANNMIGVVANGTAVVIEEIK